MSQVHRYSGTILDQSTGVTVNVTGSIYRVLPRDADPATDENQKFAFQMAASQSGGVTSPTTDLVVETSVDQTHWVVAASTTQLTGDGSVNEIEVPTALALYVRAKLLLGGATNPTATAWVSIMSTSAFTLTEIA